MVGLLAEPAAAKSQRRARRVREPHSMPNTLASRHVSSPIMQLAMPSALLAGKSVVDHHRMD